MDIYANTFVRYPSGWDPGFTNLLEMVVWSSVIYVPDSSSGASFEGSWGPSPPTPKEKKEKKKRKKKSKKREKKRKKERKEGNYE